MKTLILAALMLPALTWAAALDTPQKAIAVKDALAKEIWAIPGVNGLGVTGCNPETGVADISGADFVHCVGIYTATEEAYNRVRALYPVGTKIHDTFIWVLFVGKIVATPRLSVGTAESACEESLVPPGLE